MQKVKNKDDKGNPYHDEEGKFTSPGEENEQQSSPESDLAMPKDVVSGEKSEPVKEESSILTIKPFNPYDLDMVLSSFDNTTQQIEEILSKSSSYAELLHVKDASELSLSDRKSYLECSANEYDKQKLLDADEQTINALFLAEQIKKAPKLVQQKLVLLDEQKASIAKNEEKLINVKLQNEAEAQGGIDLSGMWVVTPTLSDYEDYVTPDGTGSSRVSRKRDYYTNAIAEIDKTIKEKEGIIDDMFSMVDDVEQAKAAIAELENLKATVEKKIENLNKFEELGNKFGQIKEEVKKEFLSQYENIEKEYSETKQRLSEVNDSAYFELVNTCTDLISKYQDESAIYSPARKDAALWFKGHNVIKQAEEKLFPTAEQHYASMTMSEIKIIDRYKSGSSAFNEPLRALNYTGGKSFGDGQSYSKAINNLTSAIDKCTWPDDIWVQRGQSAYVNCFLINGIKKSIASMTDEERNSLVGSMYIDNGFYSAGAGKGTGFSGESLIINTYCPKGTKMVYAQYRPGYKNENEMILQRGYTYRITKVENKGGQFYMDVEVMLNSDQNKPVGDELKQIEKKHYHGG